jgi:branched-chain amino acid transport system substrate-binding protein
MLVLSGALGLAATSFGVGQVAWAADELKLGVIAPMSGPGAPWGIALLRGVEIAAEEINAAGGIKAGGKSYQVKVISADDKYTGKGGVDAAMKLVHQDQVKYIIGSISSASVLAFQPITEPEKVLVMPNTYSNKVPAADKPYSFRIVMTSHEISKVQYKWIKENKPNIKKIAVLSPNDASGWAVSEHVKMAAEANGLEVVYYDFYERGTVDFYPLINKILPKKPDWFDTGASPPGDQGLMLKQARELGFEGGSSTTTGIDPDGLVKIAGEKNCEGFMGPNLDFEGPFVSKEEKAFEKKYLDKYGAPFNPIALAFYGPLYILQQGIEQANSIDTTAVMQKMGEPGWKFKAVGQEGWWGGKEYYGIDRQVVGSIAVSVMEKGKIKTLQRLYAEDVSKLLKK